MSRVRLKMTMMVFLIGATTSMAFAQPNADSVGRRGDTVYRTQSEQAPATDPYVDKIRQLLDDPNKVRLRLNADPDLSKALKVLEADGKAEDARWINRRARVKSAFTFGARKLIKNDLGLIGKIALNEDANQIAEQINALQDEWTSRFLRISREIRASMRDNIDVQSDRMTRSRARRGGQEQGRSRRSTRSDNNRDMTDEPQEPDPQEQEENAFVDNWVSAGDDSADTLYSDLEDKLLEDLAPVRLRAETLGKSRIVNAIDGVLLMRKERSEQTIAAYRERLQERQEEVSSTDNDTEDMRRSRGRRGQTNGGNDTGRRRR